ncbi:hypothetical protein DSUL_150114 [Desulfovibrionales bacterium]
MSPPPHLLAHYAATMPSSKISDIPSITLLHTPAEKQSSIRQRRDALQHALAVATITLDEQLTKALAQQERLRAMNRERAVARRAIQLLQNELYQAHRKQEQIETQLTELTSLLITREQTARTLKERCRRLKIYQVELDAAISELACRLETLAEERLKLEAILTNLESRRVELVSDISRRLQHAAIERDKIDEDLYRVTVNFKDVITARDETLKQLEDHKVSLAALNDEIKDAEHRIEILERIRTLIVERDALSGQVDASRKNRETTEQALVDARAAMEARKLRHGEREADLKKTTAKVEMLQIEVGAYQDALDQVATANARLETSSAELDSALQDIADRIKTRYTAAREMDRLSARVAWITGLQKLLE